MKNATTPKNDARSVMEQLMTTRAPESHTSLWKSLYLSEWPKIFKNYNQTHLGISRKAITGCGMALTDNHIVVASGNSGAALLAINWDQIENPAPKLLTLGGSRGPSQDIQFNRIEPNILASGSDIGTISLWDLECDPDKTKLDICSTLSGHEGRKVNGISWNPLVSSCLASIGMNSHIQVYDTTVQKTQLKMKLDTQPTDHCWNMGGNLVGYVAKKTWGLCDIREGVISSAATDCYEGAKPMRMVSTGGLNGPEFVVTSGFTKKAERIVKIWDSRNSKEALYQKELGSGVGALDLHYTPSTGIVCAIAKGDSRMNMFDVSEGKLWHIFGPSGGSFPIGSPVQYYGFLPRCMLSTEKGEQSRMTIVDSSSHEIKVLSTYKESRRRGAGVEAASAFGSSEYPDCLSRRPLATCSEWLTQKSPLDPKEALASMEPGEDNIAPCNKEVVIQNKADLSGKEDSVAYAANVMNKLVGNREEIKRMTTLKLNTDKKYKKVQMEGTDEDRDKMKKQIANLEETIRQHEKLHQGFLDTINDLSRGGYQEQIDELKNRYQRTLGNHDVFTDLTKTIDNLISSRISQNSQDNLYGHSRTEIQQMMDDTREMSRIGDSRDKIIENMASSIQSLTAKLADLEDRLQNVSNRKEISPTFNSYHHHYSLDSSKQAVISKRSANTDSKYRDRGGGLMHSSSTTNSGFGEPDMDKIFRKAAINLEEEAKTKKKRKARGS